MAQRTHTHWPGPSDGEDFDLLPAGAELPCHVTGAAPVAARIVMCGFGGAGLLSAFLLLLSGDDGDAFGAVIFGVVGLAMLTFARLLTRGTSLRITPEEVECTDLHAFRPTRWREPVSAYEGVLRRVTVRQETDDRRLLYEVLLQHPEDPRKNVKLYSSMTDAGFLDRHRHYARAFGLPTLTETEDGVERVAPEELDRPLPARAIAGVHGAIPPAGPPPDDLSIEIRGDTVTMRTRRRTPLRYLIIGPACVTGGGWWIHWAWAGLGGAAPIVLSGLLLGALFGLLLVACGLWLVAVRLTIVQVLRICPGRVESWHQLGDRAFGHLAMDSSCVREVTGGVHGAHALLRALGLLSLGGPPACPPAVNILGKDETIVFGHVLSKESRRWVRQCVLSVLAAGDPQESG